MLAINYFDLSPERVLKFFKKYNILQELPVIKLNHTKFTFLKYNLIQSKVLRLKVAGHFLKDKKYKFSQTFSPIDVY